MRLTSGSASARPVYYDRAATVQWLVYNASGVGPHGTTVRATYTVPAARVAFAEGTFVSLDRATVAAPVGNAIDAVVYTPNAGTAGHFARIVSGDNTVGVQYRQSGGALGWMTVGDNVVIQTSDASTGGTVNHSSTCKVVEYAT